MFNRANEILGSNWSLHDLRHTASFRMANDPDMSLVYVQHMLAHRQLTTTQKYLTPSRDEVIAAGIAHHARQEQRRNTSSVSPPAPAYNQEALDVLFGRRLG
ncbi:tyrosine-type recombinase/integrase [Nonomuraea fuscirosea]|uniref:tyrosine-type recombinase/integrase n=1 Tax=Nonomuraea fuscirosea TaxID=1291556 RepID=UPI0037AF619B